jgi:hypothetical protein
MNGDGADAIVADQVAEESKKLVASRSPHMNPWTVPRAAKRSLDLHWTRSAIRRNSSVVVVVRRAEAGAAPIAECR